MTQSANINTVAKVAYISNTDIVTKFSHTADTNTLATVAQIDSHISRNCQYSYSGHSSIH